jgi:hypothetical protein
MEQLGDVYAIVQANWPQILLGGAAVRSIAPWGWRYVADAYRHDPLTAVEAAAHNASDFTHRVAAKVQFAVDTGLITEEQVEVALSDPAFVKLLQRSVLDASETGSELNHEQLARLVSARLSESGETLEGIALRVACEKLRDVTDRQLKLLGLTFVATQVDPPFEPSADGEADLAKYIALCEAELGPFDDVDLHSLDFQQLESLGLLSVAAFAGRLGMRFGSHETHSPMLGRVGLYFQGYLLNEPRPIPAFQRLRRLMDGDSATGLIGMSTVRLHSIGWLLGYSAYCQLRKVPFDLRGWT